MKYSHFLKLMKQSSMPDREQMYKDILSQKTSSWTKVCAIACIVVLCIGIIGAGAYLSFGAIKLGKDNHLPKELDGISPITAITATGTKGNSILPNSVFKVTTKKSHSAKEVYDFLDVSPKSEYTIKKTSGNTFDVVFSQNLKSDTLYKLSSKLGDKTVYSWAFQTEKKFEITASSGGTKGCVSMFLTDEIWVEFSRSDVKNFEQYFSISPAVAGTFEQYGKRWVFIPSSDFAKSTVYTVTISKDIVCGDGQTLDQDYSFNVFSCVGGTYIDCLSTTNDCDSFTTSQIPTATFEFMNLDASKAKLVVYHTSSSSKFISVHNQYIKGGTVSSAIDEQFAGANKVPQDVTLEIDREKNRAHLTYPKTFEAGFYIAKLTFGDVSTYHFFEVSDYSVYTAQSGNRITLWVNDPKTQKGVSGIAVADKDANISSTDANGVAHITVPSSTSLQYLNISTPTPLVSIVKTKDTTVSDNKSFMRTDKSTYSVGEGVKLWGITQATDNQKCYIRPSWSNEKTEVKPDGDGVFTATVNTANVFSQNGYIDLIIDDTVTATAFFDVYSSSPKYCIDIKTDNNCYIDGQTVTYTINATLFDGTPAENVTITHADVTATTNSRGIATFTEIAKADNGQKAIAVFECNGQQYFETYDVFRGDIFISDIEQSGNDLNVYVNTLDKAAANFKGAPAVCQLDAKMYVNDGNNSVLQGTATANAQNGVATFKLVETDADVYYVISAGSDSITYYPNGKISQEQSAISKYVLQCKDEFDPDTTVTAKVIDTATGKAVESGSVLVTFITNGTVKSNVYDVNAISFNYDRTFENELVLSCAYYDGTGISKVADKAIYSSQKQIDISASFDKPGYAPGDTVNIDINIVGYDKKPIEATLNIAVYDSKMYIGDEYIKNANNSYLPSLYFETVKTDSAGHATVSFEAGNDIATRTVDILGIDSNFGTGRVVTDIEITSAMFIDTFIDDRVFASDDLSFSFRVDGVEAGEVCDYTAVLLKDGIQIASKTGVASKQQVKNETFGKPEAAGNYSIKITCASGTAACEAQKDFAVTDAKTQVSDIEFKQSTYLDESYGSDVTVSVYDAEYEMYFKILENMLGKTSNRIDHVLARIVANSIVSNKSAAQSDLDFALKHATPDGVYIHQGQSVAMVPQAALITAVGNDLFDRAAVKTYFDTVSKGKPDTTSVIAANIVYASIGEPVLNELYYLLDGLETYSDEQKLFLALGFAYAGDYNHAYEILNQGITDKIHNANGISTLEADTPVATEYMSCLAAIVTSKISHTSAKDFIKGVVNAQDSALSGLAFCEFTKGCTMLLTGKNAIVFTDAEGKSETITYNKSEHISFNIEKSDLGKIKIGQKDGQSFCAVFETKDIDATEYTVIESTVASISTPNTFVNDGDRVLLTVVFDTEGIKVENGYAVLSLPHNLKYLGATVIEGTASIIKDDKVYIYKSSGKATVQIECYAATEGRYTVYAPTVIDRNNKQTANANFIEITVQ